MLRFGFPPTLKSSKLSPGPHQWRGRNKGFLIAECVWLAAIVGLLVYEAWALGTQHMTLSRAVWIAQRGQYGPLIPFLLGFLMGHFVWSGQ